MKILHVTNSMNPAYGGLSACLGSLVPALAALGHPSEIVSLDAPAAPWLSPLPFPAYGLGPVRPGYGYAPRLASWLHDASSRYDAVIVHGLWQYHGRAVQQSLDTPYYIFPHGMLDPWFQRQYPLKHIKKWLYWWLAERRVLRSAAAVLFTCEEERRLAHGSFPAGSYREQVVAFGIATPRDDPAGQREAFFQACPELRDRAFWLFLGRIHPKKGADLLIDAYARLAAKESALPRLVMAGPCSDADYLQQLKTRAATSCPAGAVLFPGMLMDDVKWGALRAAEVFVLPSHQENFGIAVAEALACSTPVLISNQVNIWREIASDGAGLVEPDTAEGTFELLRRWQTRNPGLRQLMRYAAQRSFHQRYEIGAAARSLITALQTVRSAP